MPGFDNDEGVGKQIEDSIQRQLTNPNPNPNPVPAAEKKNTFPAWTGLVLIMIAALMLLIATKKKKRNIKEV
jgi:LPXTG-motif cell wall-anchored protein